MLRVNYDTMNQLVALLRTSAGTITERLDALEAQLEPLRSNWEGDAQTAYLTSKAQWDAAMLGLIELLERTRGNVDIATATYQGADRQGYQSFSNII